MSGTSLDGLDIALCDITGHGPQTELNLRHFKTCPYPAEVSDKLRPVVSADQVSLRSVCLLHAWLGRYHADLIMEALREWQVEPGQVSCIASHGQTIYHAPRIQHREKGMPNATLQIGDGDHIARRTGILTLSDFRQKHVAVGGEGAPLASPVDRMLFTDENEPRILLNIGGIANFSFLPVPDSDHSYVTTDTGPGNTLLNTACQRLFEREYDQDGTIAAGGT
ncbi:MAG: anhydro-N-acetylmuramic acid kinase, partial [Balneolaceae bacterium]